VKRLIPALLALFVLSSAVLSGGCKQRTVTVKNGEVVICTAGEILEDNTEELDIPADEVANYSVTTRVITCDRHGSLADLYAEAQRLIAAGDLDGAREKLASIVDRDPTFGKAKQQLDQIDAGTTPTEDTEPVTEDTPATPDAPETPDGDEVIGPIASLLRYVPDVLNGYSAQEIIVDPVILFRHYIPVSKDTDQLVISAEQTIDAKSAAAVVAEAKGTYPYNAATVDLGGKNGYFGTKGGFAVVIFTEGAVVVSVELHATKGDGKALKNVVVAVATTIAK
jgi:hypothetical protein